MKIALPGSSSGTMRQPAAGLLVAGVLLFSPVTAALAQAPAAEPSATAQAPALPPPRDNGSTASARMNMKPLTRTAKPASDGDAGSSTVTTGSVAKTAAAAAAPVAAGAKSAGRCSRMAFEVNDYGKDGPTKDSKDLLDKHVAKWAAEKGVKKYTVGKKVVNCRLFLDFGVADEHTCRAEAPVCW